MSSNNIFSLLYVKQLVQLSLLFLAIPVSCSCCSYHVASAAAAVAAAAPAAAPATDTPCCALLLLPKNTVVAYSISIDQPGIIRARITHPACLLTIPSRHGGIELASAAPRNHLSADELGELLDQWKLDQTARKILDQKNTSPMTIRYWYFTLSCWREETRLYKILDRRLAIWPKETGDT